MLQIGAALFYYKSGETVLQIGAASLLQNGASVVTNWGSYYKLGQPLLQNRAAIINSGKMYYKLGQVLQIKAIITNWGIADVSKCNSIQQHRILLSDVPRLHHQSLVKRSNTGKFILDF